MSYNSIVVIEEKSPLEREFWKFWFYDNHNVLIVDYYAIEKRETKRHKWRAEKAYERLYRRGWNAIERPPLPEHIALKALDQFMRQITVSVDWK